MKSNVLFIFLLLISPVAVAGVSNVVKQLQDEWAGIKYKTPENEQEKKFEQLANKAEILASKNPSDVDVLIWEGIILSTYAGAKGGPGALSEAKKAKSSFEHAIELDPAALDGAAYTSLGSLYYMVPGWPIGFGDKEKAEELLKKGLAENPDGIDSNFFYGDFLKSEGKYSDALVVLEKALRAPPRPGREVADQGRRKEIEADIAQVKHLLSEKTASVSPR